MIVRRQTSVRKKDVGNRIGQSLKPWNVVNWHLTGWNHIYTGSRVWSLLGAARTSHRSCTGRQRNQQTSWWLCRADIIKTEMRRDSNIWIFSEGSWYGNIRN